ncbi:HNH endonuclease [Prauserella flavalba]|uniref:HNH endonuclease n=1 Tax=Prauserella flavalba TaxID=1477506 RepID=UPI0036F09C7C
MPYFLNSDTIGRDPRWMVLAESKIAKRDALQAALLRLQCETASHLHDGYLTRDTALQLVDGREWLLDALCTPALGARPFLHRPGDSCDARNCLDDSGGWVEGFDFRLCSFSKRNPTKAEYDRNKAQKADSRDARLRALVYTRDAGCCRYCGSGPLRKKGMGRAKDRRRALQYDHVDPDRPAGADAANYVLACARCNEAKGHRTPDEAGMVLRPAPTDEQRAELLAREETLFDLPDTPTDNAPDNHNDNQRDNHSDNAPTQPPDLAADSSPGDSTTGDVRPQITDQPEEQPARTRAEGSGSGRVGHRRSTPVPHSPTQPARTPDAPDIYHRRSRDPAPEPATPPPPHAPPDPGSPEEDQKPRCIHGQLLDDDACELCDQARTRNEPP